MWRNPTFICAMSLTLAVVAWGMVDTLGLAAWASSTVDLLFRSRGWFVMLTTTFLLLGAIILAAGRAGRIRLGAEDERPEFSTFSWLVMMFAAGMGVGLLFYGVAEPVGHFLFFRNYQNAPEAASSALSLTVFHWGLHAWAIYGSCGLVIAYFGFRKNAPQLLSSPLRHVYGENVWTRGFGFVFDTLAVYATAIGLAGSMAMGVFQVQSGVARMLGLGETGLGLALGVFAVLCLASFLPLVRDLGSGMAKLSSLAILLTVGLMLYLLLAGPTGFIMSSVTEMLGNYASQVLPHGLQTYAFWEENVLKYFSDWTLNYMVWWLAWAPFVGVFIARISRGRTIREFLSGVLLAPTGFSLVWFGVLGSAGFYEAYFERFDPQIVVRDVNAATFALLESFPLAWLTSAATIAAAFLFIVTSVVSAAYVLAMFSSRGDTDPPTSMKLTWGVILAALGLVMIVTGSVDAVRAIIALSANPFIFIVLTLFVCLLRALRRDMNHHGEES